MLKKIWQLCCQQPELPFTIVAAMMWAASIGVWTNDFNRLIEPQGANSKPIELRR